MRPARILVVDDETNIRTALAKILEREGHAVVTADCGDSALGLLQDTAFDLVVTDLKMVGVSGMQVLQAVKRLHPDTEVILLTAYGTIESAVDAMKTGA